VDDLIARSVASWLERSNFNSVSEIAIALAKVDLPRDDCAAMLDQHGANLEAMMKRRHWIVHRADANLARGSGHFAALSLHPEMARSWMSSVERFGAALLDLL
jgi:hypothetical protein